MYTDLCELVSSIDEEHLYTVLPFVGNTDILVQSIRYISHGDIDMVLLKVLHRYCRYTYRLRSLMDSLNTDRYTLEVSDNHLTVNIISSSIPTDYMSMIEKQYPGSTVSIKDDGISMILYVDEPYILYRGIKSIYGDRSVPLLDIPEL